MPELPEVEAFRRRMARLARGRVVERAELRDARRLLEAPPAAVEGALAGRRLGAPRRHGKWLLVPAAGGPWLALHFGMTGDLAPLDGAPPRAARLVLRFRGGGGVVFTDPRKFGRIALADSPAAFAAERGLGPDALGLARGDFLARLEGRRGGLKAALLDQSVVAGLGNLWIDESLWRARLHPATRVDALDAAARRRLHAAVQSVLRAAVRPRRGDALPEAPLLRARGRGGRCPRCKAPLGRGVVAGRTTYWCPREQAPRS